MAKSKINKSSEEFVEIKFPKSMETISYSFFMDVPNKWTEDGKFERPSSIPVSKKWYDELQSLYDKFEIPLDNRIDFDWAFVSMAFAAKNAPTLDAFQSDINSNQKKLGKLFSLLEEFTSEKKILTAITFKFIENKDDWNNQLRRPKPNKQKSLSFNDYMPTQFTQRILQNYKQCESYESYSRIFERSKTPMVPIFGKHKNTFKEKQYIYSCAIWDFVHRHLFNVAYIEPHSRDEEKKELKRLHKTYSQNNILEFIGRMLIISGLLKMKKNPVLREDIIEVIRKKLENKIKSEKAFYQKDLAKYPEHIKKDLLKYKTEFEGDYINASVWWDWIRWRRQVERSGPRPFPLFF
jgi:hypothetical protein